MMVPLTIGAFAMGHFAEQSILLAKPDWFDVMSVITVGIGVWLYNWFDEKPQKASTENLQ